MPENPNKDYYYIIRETGNTEPILVEYGFIDNAKDANKLRTSLKNYVEGVVKALAEYTGYPYYPPGEEEAKSFYIVQRGDTLYSISRRFNIPVDEIKRINNLTSNNLSIGQTLYLTENILPTNIYIVQRGDTLYSIALKYNTTVDEIKRMNNLQTNTLSIGQELQLPNGKIPDENPIPDIDEESIYIVQKGDSLWKIAQKYNISVAELIEMNNLTDLTLQIGQPLLVPQEEIESEEVYIVQKGDTLWSIAKANGIEVSKLKEINNLTSNLLSIGQKLKIK